MTRLITLLLFITLSFIAHAETATAPSNQQGDVRVPLDTYEKMLEQLRQKPKPAPAGYAIGQSDVQVDIVEHDDRTTSRVTVNTTIETLENHWTLIPVLSPGAAITSVKVDGQPAQLIQGAESMYWGTQKAGTSRLSLTYSVDATRSNDGYLLPIPVPKAAATRLTVNFPGEDVELAVVPSADLHTVKNRKNSVTTASIPMTTSVLISWRTPAKQDYLISQAAYSGDYQGDAIVWTADFKIDIFTGESVHLRLMPSVVTLNQVTIDKATATITEENGYFVAITRGRGSHTARVKFQTGIAKDQGPPHSVVYVPRVPVSRFDLSLPGKKEITVSPPTNVVAKTDKEHTVATAYIPMSDQATFSWVDAVPTEVKTKVSANANIYHIMHAEEGVLHAQAIIVYDITHGETNILSFYVPAIAQVNSITASQGGISDWIVEDTQNKAEKRVSVFLDRKVQGEFSLDVRYEQLTKSADNDSISIPFIKAANIHRQRGMVALLAGPELALKPLQEEGVTKVGENQLPAFVRNSISMTVAHTYKYTGDAVALSATAVAPERKQGKFDAQIDTLISLGEVSMKGSASALVQVKSGALLDLDLRLPDQINILSVAGPSIRSHKVKTDGNQQLIHVEFTQEMDGQFRIELNYEKILGDADPELEVPTVSIDGAEVEHGRIAVEALTAVEVNVAQAQQLTSVDINELPQQLVLKTSNPILLAFKYIRTDPPYRLALKTVRHKELEVQSAAIETAQYQTLVTDDGLAVTTARYWVRNSRRQFLRLDLPTGAEVWSAFVNNLAEKPANAGDTKKTENAVLIKLINSTAGFPVEIVYATPIEKMGMLGSVSSRLPQPDMVVTKSIWDVYMPTGPNYHNIDTNMKTILKGAWSNPRRETGENTAAETASRQPLRIDVPTEGIHFNFEKLYANQSDDAAYFTIHYASAQGAWIGKLISLAGVLLVWLGIFIMRKRDPKQMTVYAASMAAGVICLLVSLGYLKTDPSLAASGAVLGGLVYGITTLLPKLKQWRASRIEQE